ADIIAVIRSTGQSLLDYVPVGITTSGFGGTYATRENFALMRKALDEIIPQLGRYIYLVNYSSGLCMPEIAALASLERLDILLNDAMYGILFRDINMQRTFIDQYFSRLIIAYSGIIINTGEDNYLTTADAYEEAHTVLASQFINERFALKAGLKKEQIGLGHAFEIDPEKEDGFLFEIAQAQMIREIFPHSPIKYMPPTKHIDGNIFKAYLMNGMFNLASILTNQSIHLLGMLTEAIHTPFISDRYLAIENARYIMKNAKHLSEEINFLKNGRVQKRAREVLLKALKLLKEIKGLGLMAAIKHKKFAQISRAKDSGKGKEGVILKEKDYFNPVLDLIKKELNLK
ncbi:MAG: D-lysine 5,6-aminomutase subunit alpha, partial [Armatimonadetes bacterium]|nr:D-lysine 5,6-aminomutase subunit alpha [Armatimonadota bacterium]